MRRIVAQFAPCHQPGIGLAHTSFRARRTDIYLYNVIYSVYLEANADKTKYMVMSRDQNAGRIPSVRIDNSTFDRVEEFKYLGTNFTNQSSIAEDIKSRLKSGNAIYHSVQNLLSSRLLSKNLKI